MVTRRPENISQYTKWLRAQGVDVNKQMTTHFEAVVLRVKDTLSKSAEWKNLLKHLRTVHERFVLDTGYPLLAHTGEALELNTKSFESFLLKTFRLNVLTNSAWPEPPDGGWILPCNWTSRANDLVRTCIPVRYLDGVSFLLEELGKFAELQNLNFSKYYVGGTDGYYAGHAYIRRTFEIPKVTFDTEFVEVSIELQVTTQLHEVIRHLLHSHFEARRKKCPERPETWQWDYASDEFSANYLGHMLHYVDGMVVDLRRKSAKGKK